MKERTIRLAVLDNETGTFGEAARRALDGPRFTVQTFSGNTFASLRGIDIVVVGTSGDLGLYEVKERADRVRELHGSLPNTPVVFATQSFSAEVVKTLVSAGAISVVPFEALSQTIGNLVSCSGFVSSEGSGYGFTSYVVDRAHDPESGRLDAKRISHLFGVPLSTVAHAVGITPSALSKRPTAPTAQEGLRELTFVWRSLMNALETEQKCRAWLHAPRPDLGDLPPLELLIRGSAKDLGNYIRRALAGEPA